MPYHIAWHTDGVVWNFYDQVTADEISEVNQGFFRDPRSEHATYQLIDTLGITQLLWTAPDILETSAFDAGASRRKSSLKIAFVTQDSEIWELIGHYIQLSELLGNSWEIRGFSDLGEARQWVGLND